MTCLTLSYWTIFHSWNYIIPCMMSHHTYHIYDYIEFDTISYLLLWHIYNNVRCGTLQQLAQCDIWR